MNRRRLFAALAGAAGMSAAVSARESQPAAARQRPPRWERSGEAAGSAKYQAEPADRSTEAGAVAPRPAIDGAALGLRVNAAEDQSRQLQRAIDYAAAARAVLHLTPGFYRAAGLKLPPYTAVAAASGTTRIMMSAGETLITASGSDHISLSGLILDGGDVPLQGRGLIDLSRGRDIRIADCAIINAGGNGIALQDIEGEIAGNTVSAADAAIFSLDAAGLKISGNTVRDAGNNGILVWRSQHGDDGTLVIDNRIENVANKSGGSGQYGNGVNVFRADNVIVRGNRIRNVAFSAVRGNAASNMQIIGNTCSSVGEVALYAEFGFQGAVIANNIVDGAAVGISVTNFNQGGRLAVVQGNLIRNLVPRRPQGTDPRDDAGVGIAVEADTLVSGNVVENAPHAGIAVGAGRYLRDVVVSSNMVRSAGYGITVSVAPGTGTTLVADNLIAESRLGAVVGMEWNRPVTGDLTKEGDNRYAQLSLSGNRVR